MQRRNEEVRKINSENQQMLGKIMKIMNRKPVATGLDRLPIKKQSSVDELMEGEAGHSIDTFQGNADIKLIQSNLEMKMMNNRFSFEIVAGAHSPVRSINPFKQSVSSQHRELSPAAYDTKPLNSTADIQDAN